MANLTQAELKALLRYDPDTGAFTYIADAGRFGRIKAGSIAGSIDKTTGYLQVKIGRTRYLQHRLAFLYVTGAWPSNSVDHINGARTCNRWQNLRDVSVRTNNQNIRQAHRDNKTGFLGVRLQPSGTYVAELYVDGKNRRMGASATPEVAHEKYLAAKRQHHAGSTL